MWIEAARPPNAPPAMTTLDDSPAVSDANAQVTGARLYRPAPDSDACICAAKSGRGDGVVG